METGPDAPREAERRLHGLFEKHYGELLGFALRYVDSEDTAADVVQEVFVRVWSRRSDRRLVDVSRAYLFRAVRNEALNRQTADERRRERWSFSTGERRPPTPEDELQDRELAREVERAIADLPPRCREIFLLVRDDGLTYREAAEVLDLSESTVATQMGRALQRLRHRLADWLD